MHVYHGILVFVGHCSVACDLHILSAEWGEGGSRGRGISRAESCPFLAPNALKCGRSPLLDVVGTSCAFLLSFSFAVFKVSARTKANSIRIDEQTSTRTRTRCISKLAKDRNRRTTLCLNIRGFNFAVREFSAQAHTILSAHNKCRAQSGVQQRVAHRQSCLIE